MKEKDMYEKIKPERESKQVVNKQASDKAIIIAIVTIMVLLVAGIMVYYFGFKGKGEIASYDLNSERQIVTEAEYELYYRTFAPMLVYYGYSTEEIEDYIAEKIIVDKLVLAEANAKDYQVSEEDKADIEETFSNDEYVSDFTSRGIAINEVKQLFYDDSIISTYLEDLQAAATEEDVRNYIISQEGDNADFNLYKTRHILFSFTSDMTAEDKEALRQEAESILGRVKAGEDFAALAKEHSDDTYTETYYGGIVSVTATNVVEPYYTAVKATAAGNIYPTLVESAYGYHIIKVDEITVNGRLTDESEVKYYVDSIVYAKQDASKPEYNEEKIAKIAAKVNGELGLAVSKENVQ